MDGVYISGSARYSAVATDTLVGQRGGGAVLYQASPQFLVEAIQQFDPYVVNFHLGKGKWRWFILGCYLATDDASTLQSVVTALRERPRGDKLLVTGDFNADLSRPEGADQDKEIAAVLVAAGLENMSLSTFCSDQSTNHPHTSLHTYAKMY